MTKEQIENWRYRLNELHNEMDCEVERDWNKILDEDQERPGVFTEKVEEREMIRRGRRVVSFLESGIDNLDLMRKTFNK